MSKSELFSYIGLANIQRVKEILEITGGNLVNSKNSVSHTPLMVCILNRVFGYDTRKQNLYNIAVELLKHKTNLNLRSDSEKTALMYACENGDIQMVKLLLDYGADINLETKSKHFTALYFACWHGLVELIKLLIDNGAIIDKKCISVINDPDLKIYLTDQMNKQKVFVYLVHHNYINKKNKNKGTYLPKDLIRYTREEFLFSKKKYKRSKRSKRSK